MNNTELISENNKLKEQIILLENELNEVKHKLHTYQSNSKKYYENNKEKIIEKVKEYNKQNKYIPTPEQKKKWARTAYLKKKEKIENENV